MLKKIILAVALALPFIGANAQTLKVGLVDTNALIQALPDTQEATAKVQAASKQYEEQRNKLMEEGQRLVDEFQKLGDDTLPAIRERKARDIQDQEQKIQSFLQNAEQDLQRMHNELMAPVVQKIRDAVESVGKEGNYSMIQNYAPDLTLYYASPVEDVTPLVKAKLGIK
ncbi:MAG: OmpH family outer membrane protein [Muribaculaceae bacterium]|nr:OmpH family outer membrane protein [Muribaculaceae bacterium]